MIIIKTALVSLLSVAELFILTKLMGKRQISQLSFFDYINGITIGSISAEMAVNDFRKAAVPAAAMAVYALTAICISLICDKSVNARKIFNGKPAVIMDRGKINRKAMKKEKLDFNELLMQARISGYYDLSKVQTAILEANGTLSFLPKAGERPVTPSDIDIKPQTETMFVPMIIDGRIIEKNLVSRNKSIAWLNGQIKKQNAGDPENILLALFDGSRLVIYRNEQ